MEGSRVVEYGRERDRERMVCKHGVWVLLCCVEDAVDQVVGSQILIGYEPNDSNSQ